MMRAIHATVRIRRGEGWDVRQEAESIDGKRYRFTYGWKITLDDSRIYVDEIAWIPDEKSGFPDSEITWLASGDLIDIMEEDK